MPDIPSWVAALVGALATGLITWGVINERLKNHAEAVKKIPQLEAHQTRCTEEITQLRNHVQEEVGRIRFHAEETRRQLRSTELDVAMLKGKDDNT